MGYLICNEPSLYSIGKVLLKKKNLKFIKNEAPGAGSCDRYLFGYKENVNNIKSYDSFVIMLERCGKVGVKVQAILARRTSSFHGLVVPCDLSLSKSNGLNNGTWAPYALEPMDFKGNL